MNFHTLILTVLIIYYLVTSIVDGTESTGSFSIISTLKNGTHCHSFVTNCRGQVIFDRGIQDCGGHCLVSGRSDMPNNQLYCVHMSILSTDDRIYDKHDYAVAEHGNPDCFKVTGNSDRFAFFKQTPCPTNPPKRNCSNH
ncbi:hypothetical protein F8M41_016439 [Gigaspora margarita]|uniref:Secreted protein n=1 Tax=Gigaspora margarita TaxID=4874 RepID=A0A8H4EMX1_GIGMA|nr:hypothetical protein F8M41_016439 [Gigaspora margarita]